MFAIEWTDTAIATVWHTLRRHPVLAPGFRRRALAAAIDRALYDQ